MTAVPLCPRSPQPSRSAQPRCSDAPQFRLVLGNVGELAFESFGDAGVKRASRLAQQRAIGRVLHQRVLEQIRRVWRHTLPEQQTCLNEPVERRSRVPPPPCGPPQLAEHERTLAQSPLRSVPPPWPRRADRAAPSARRAGLREPHKQGRGTAAAVRSAAPSLPASSTAFVISSTNSGMPSVRSMMSCRMFAGRSLLPATRSIMAAISRSPSRLIVSAVTYGRPIHGGSNSGRNVMTSSTRRVLIRSTIRPNSFQARGVAPMCILEDHQHRILRDRRRDLREERFQRSLPAAAAALVRAPDNVRHSAATAFRQTARRPVLRSSSARAPHRACRVSLARCRRA